MPQPGEFDRPGTVAERGRQLAYLGQCLFRTGLVLVAEESKTALHECRRIGPKAHILGHLVQNARVEIDELVDAGVVIFGL